MRRYVDENNSFRDIAWMVFRWKGQNRLNAPTVTIEFGTLKEMVIAKRSIYSEIIENNPAAAANYELAKEFRKDETTFQFFGTMFVFKSKEKSVPRPGWGPYYSDNIEWREDYANLPRS